MLLAKGISKTYTVKEKEKFFSFSKKREIEALKHLDITIEPGKITGLLGINGAGKSTTIKILSSILEPTTGTVEVDGIDAILHPQRVKKMVNVITGGERNLYWRLSARENLEYFGALYGLSKKELNLYIDYSLALVGLKDTKTPVERYSKGMKQRLQIARGLINDPKYLFLDEPTLGLDVSIAKELRHYIKKLSKVEKKGILLTTHYLSEVEELCDWVYIINQGELLMEGSPSDIISKVIPETNLKVIVESSTLKLKQELKEYTNMKHARLHTVEENGITTITISAKEDITSDVVTIISNHGVSILSFKTEDSNLEDALLALTNREGDKEYELVKSS
ncbi:hypothetical protein AS034_16110 [[Bacillus] enclensis]|uniref:ABC-2 type transport system ATP-binding protein n=1 Tax=[Bacillus] enclensis TaxID=1402860 RepID=A0A0V8HCH4_9BACI|nr:ABC transporter ATP-binding protein [[Bacillus] enclensis]KSU60365.1 hypothetical protein AS034_16110 [[Bacillus] enclensis]SCC23691.1 ABC-2 type transport system ATP-binding protein [[Bacillus] enclensis]